MIKRVRIKLDIPAVVAHLSKEEGRALSTEEVLRWLGEAGFVRDGAYWNVAESDLGQVEPSEVLEIESVR